jgi:protein SCO1/2
MATIRSTVLLCLGFITIVVGMFVISVTRTPQLSDEELRAAGVFLLPQPRALAEFQLQDQFGENFVLENLENKWTFIFFGFTNCPDICPTSMAELGRAERALHNADDMAEHPLQGVLVSVDPDHDTPDRLGKYAEAFSPRFLGVSGQRESLVALTQQVNVAFAKVPMPMARQAPGSESGYTVDHTGNLVIINPRGHYHGFIKLPHKSETIRLTYQTLAAQF